ncbi:MAG TPA: ATP-binding cassette domain-containing protein [Acidimicrobiia bacterium]|nr:ATP-binding cassette domain-containing protein [Acidimicrobiia bacterium]
MEVVSPGSLQARIEVERSASFTLDIDLSVDAGTTAALLGPNGAGKTTTVAVLAGLLPLDRGRLALGDAVIDDPATGVFVPSHERRVGVVFQDYLLFPHLTVADNVAFGLRSRGVGRAEASVTAREWLQRMGLDGLADRKPGDLSGGQAQRVALARALVIEPDLLLLDEPLSALDATNRAELRRALADHLASFPGPRLLITHEPAEAFLLADEVYLIEDGVITQAGSPEDIRLRPKTRYAADLAGSNLIRGIAAAGTVATDTHPLHIADHDCAGPVLLTIAPTAISVHRHPPEGSPRNTWRTVVERVEPLGERSRLGIGAPLPLTVEVTRDATEALALTPGVEVWVAVKATEIGVETDG